MGNDGQEVSTYFLLQLVRWANGVGDLTRDFDVVICADCLFFDEGRAQLLECLKKALKPGGIAIVIAPSRSGTFEVTRNMIDTHSAEPVYASFRTLSLRSEMTGLLW